tara:strand:+ start:229 stop:840 length:612 start_codon:yes stop_codon:yes gene_type:complete
MGSKRIGLARTQALIENLKRQLNVGSLSFTGMTGGIETTGAIAAGSQCQLTTMNATAGSDLADDTNAVNFVREDHGKVFKCLADGLAKSLNLPTNMAAADVGTKIVIVQGAALVASGVLTINANTGNTFSANSYVIGHASSAGTITRPAEANNRLVITGAATNSAFGAGSRITCECVAAGEWYIEVECVPLGTGNAAFAFSTV